MPSVSSFDEVNACIQAGFSEKRLYSERVNSINGVFNVFVLISVISAQSVFVNCFSWFFFQEYQPDVKQVLEYKEFGLVSLLIKNKSFGLQ